MSTRIPRFVAPAVGAALALALAAPASATPLRAAPAAAAVTATPPGGSYRALAPSRVADTRSGLGVAATGRVTDTTFKVLGVGSVPATGVSAVVLNLTVTDATSAGWAVAYPNGTAMPGTSNLNLDARPGAAVPAMVVVKPGADGRVAVHVSSSASVIADVEGYFTTADTAGTTGLFTPMAPTRLMDTRVDSGRTALGPGAVTNLTLAGKPGIPSDATAVVLNTTVTNSTAGGWVTDYPAGQTPTTSTVNFLAGQTKANRSIVTLGTGGAISVQNASGTSDVIIDITGYFTASDAGSYFVPIDSVRMVDSRNLNLGNARPQLNAGSVTPIRVAGNQLTSQGAVQYLPSMDSVTPPSAILGNLTSADQLGSGWDTLYPGDPGNPGAMPATSDLNYEPTAAIANAVITGLGPAGGVTFTPSSPSDFILDVSGYFTGGGGNPTGTGIWQSTSQPTVPVTATVPSYTYTAQTSGLTALAISGAFLLGLKSDGSISAWPAAGLVVPPTPWIPLTNMLGGVKSLVGSDQAAALKTDGTVWIAAVTGTTPSFTHVAGLTAVSKIFDGGHVFYALMADGSVRQISADGTSVTAVAGLAKIVSVGAKTVGDTFETQGFAVDSTGAVWAFNPVSPSTTATKLTQVCPALTVSGANEVYLGCKDGSVQRITGIGSLPVTQRYITAAAAITFGAAGPQALDTTGTVLALAGAESWAPVSGLTGIKAIAGRVTDTWSYYATG